MKKDIIAGGIIILGVGFILDYYRLANFYIMTVLAAVNLGLGWIMTPLPTVQTGVQDFRDMKEQVAVNRAFIQGVIYRVVITKEYVLCQRLVRLPFGFMAAFIVAFAIVGVGVGGFTGYSIGEYIYYYSLQRRLILGDQVVKRGDLTIQNSDVKKVELNLRRGGIIIHNAGYPSELKIRIGGKPARALSSSIVDFFGERLTIAE